MSECSEEKKQLFTLQLGLTYDLLMTGSTTPENTEVAESSDEF